MDERKAGSVALAGLGSSGRESELALRHRALLYELSLGFSELIELDRLLPLVMAKSREALGFESCAVLLLDAEKEELFFPCVADVAPDVEERFREIRIPADRGIAGWVLSHGLAQYVPDVTRDPRWYGKVDEQTGMQSHSLLCAPLRTSRGVIGVIELRNKLSGEVAEDDIELASALAESIAIAIQNAQRYQRQTDSVERLRERVAVLGRDMARQIGFNEIIGQSAAMRAVFQLMETAVSAPVTVLIRGETGTGKEIVARAIHANGPRRDSPFIAVNCGAVAEGVLASELFGHVKGAFTGAISDRKGLFEVADGGTIFLDEVGDTPLTMQAALLRVLQEGEIVPVGATKPRRVDVRVISATHRNLDDAVRAGDFRQDLFYRVSVFPITLPALREHADDIPLLVAHFVTRTARKFDKSIASIEPAAIDALVHHEWPGNVRELQNVIERAVALTRAGGSIGLEQLSVSPAAPLAYAPAAGDLPLREARDLFEQRYIAEALRKNRGNASRTAKMLGLSRSALHEKIQRYGLREDVDESPVSKAKVKRQKAEGKG
jgi:Nif-specific regulatory protein